MSTDSVTLDYQGDKINVLLINERVWVKTDELASRLGLGSKRAVLNIVRRHKDDFGDDETQMIVLDTNGGPQTLRVFSLFGIRVLAALSDTPEAKQFRRWIVSVVDNKIYRGTLPPLLLNDEAVDV